MLRGRTRPGDRSKQGTPSVSQPIMAGTNRSQIEGYANLLPTSVSGAFPDAPYTRIENRITYYTGRYELTNPRVVLPNWGLSSGEKNGPDDINVEVGYETSSPAATSLWEFTSSVTNATISGGGIATTLPLSLTWPSATSRIIRAGASFASGDTLYYGFLMDMTPRINNNPASQVGGTGNMTGGTAGLFSYGYGPLNIVGDLPAGAWSVALLGDSILQGVSEGDDAFKNHCFASKGLWLVTGGGIPYTNYSRASEFLASYVGSGGAKRRDQLKYHNAAIFGFPANDLGGSPSLSTVQNNFISVWSAARQAMIDAGHTQTHLAQLTIIPRTVGASDMTPINANYTDGGLRDQLNAWFYTQVGIYIDSVIDVSTPIEDPADHTKFNTSGAELTADGTHPNDAGSALMQPAVTAWGNAII